MATQQHASSQNKNAEKAPIIIKKYANRRLYNTDTSTYITLEELCELVKKGADFVVQDAKTEEDLTRQVLVQIIFEQESKKYSLLPEPFLRSIIGYYDDKMRDMLPPYLEAMMAGFKTNQDKIQDYFGKSFKPFNPLNPMDQLEEMRKQSSEFMQNTFRMFNPFEQMMGGKKDDGKK
jgi:polyhydroxyalkanoate synthesis repressor PhaR